MVQTFSRFVWGPVLQEALPREGIVSAELGVHTPKRGSTRMTCLLDTFKAASWRAATFSYESGLGMIPSLQNSIQILLGGQKIGLHLQHLLQIWG